MMDLSVLSLLILSIFGEVTTQNIESIIPVIDLQAGSENTVPLSFNDLFTVLDYVIDEPASIVLEDDFALNNEEQQQRSKKNMHLFDYVGNMALDPIDYEDLATVFRTEKNHSKSNKDSSSSSSSSSSESIEQMIEESEQLGKIKLLENLPENIEMFDYKNFVESNPNVRDEIQQTYSVPGEENVPTVMKNAIPNMENDVFLNYIKSNRVDVLEYVIWLFLILFVSYFLKKAYDVACKKEQTAFPSMGSPKVPIVLMEEGGKSAMKSNK